MNTTPYIVSLSDSPPEDNAAHLSMMGGKGAALSTLVHAALPVPEGFVLTVRGYSEFIATHGLQAQIETQLNTHDLNDPQALQAVQQAITGAMHALPLPEVLLTAIHNAYAALNSPPVAVRSSATAEDLPQQSFAGQHDSYLNVEGEKDLADAIKSCWLSLWNARAISYRHAAGIDHLDVAMAVIVQRMVNPDVSGILFTRDPAGNDPRNLTNVTRESDIMNLRRLAGTILFLAFSASLPAADKFEPNWDSLKNYRCPEWFRDVKFGQP